MAFDINTAKPKIGGFDISTAKPSQAAPVHDDFIPTEEALSVQQNKPESSFIDNAIGLGEAALATATGATGGAFGFLGGSLEGMARNLSGEITQEEARNLAQQRASGLTYAPRTEEGQGIVKDIGSIAGALPPVLGVGVAPNAALSGMRAKLSRVKTPAGKRKIIADQIKRGDINAGNIAKALNDNGDLITNKNTKKAIKLMGDGDEAYSAAINFENMNTATRKQVNKMLDVLVANKESLDPVKMMENRPSNVVGDSLAFRISKLNNYKKSASKKIGDIINGDVGSKQVDVSAARDSFLKLLADEDVSVGMADGKLVADTSKTLTNIGEVIGDKKLNNILDRIKTGKMTAKEAHKVKRQIRELVSYDTQAVGAPKVSEAIEGAIKELSTGLGDGISQVSNQYKNANKVFSESIESLKLADKMLGKNIMIGDELATSKLGSLSKRIGTNLTSKDDVYKLIDILDESLLKRSFTAKDSIRQQVAALADLEKIFKVESAQAPFGFQSRVAQGVAEGALTGGVPSREILNVALDKFKNMSKQDFNDKIKALRTLTKQKD